MTSPRERGADLARFYTVTEPQRHPRGYTVYKVTARVSEGVGRYVCILSMLYILPN
uniref:Sorting nexin 15 n=1 Tax=Ursus americanus TaxID=9643 RepID=A0A452QXJ7_URSAM